MVVCQTETVKKFDIKNNKQKNIKYNFYIFNYFDFIEKDSYKKTTWNNIANLIYNIVLKEDIFNFEIDCYSIYDLLSCSKKTQDNDYLLLEEINSIEQNEFALNNLIPLFNPNKIIYFGFECQSHPCHIYLKYNSQLFSLIKNKFFNCDFRSFKNANEIIWIPTFHTNFNNIEIENMDFSLLGNTYNQFNYKLNVDTKSDSEYFIINNPFKGYNLFRNEIIYKYKDRYPKYKFYGNDIESHQYFKNDVILINENELYSNIANLSQYNRLIYKIQIISNYKFVIVSENQNIYTYVSEKLIDCIMSGSLPIYYGFLEIDEFFPELFNNGVINGLRYSFDEIFYLIENMTNEEYINRIENLRKYTNKYIKFFSYYNSFNYILHKLFNKDFENNELLQILENINTKIQRKNLN